MEVRLYGNWEKREEVTEMLKNIFRKYSESYAYVIPNVRFMGGDEVFIDVFPLYSKYSEARYSHEDLAKKISGLGRCAIYFHPAIDGYNFRTKDL